MVFCKECNVKFSKPSNLRAHVKKKHPDKLEELAPKVKQSQSVVKCLECHKSFTNLGNLRRHVKEQHPDRLQELAPLREKNYKCPHCSQQFEVFKNLIEHKKNHQTTKKLKCVLCQYIGPHRENIIEHYRADHFLPIEIETLHFESLNEFQLWKSNIEETTFSSFINRNGSKKVSQGTRIIYNCHRSGKFRSRGKNIRKLKMQGSNKMNGYCPAMISIIFNNNKCEVKYCKSHIGHEQDLAHLFLSESQRHSIAVKIASKIPFQTILDEIRDSGSICHLERLHLLTRKDLYNIEQCSKIFYLNEGDSVMDTDNESTFLTNTVSSHRPTDRNLEEEKNKFFNKLLNELNEKITTFEELEATERLVGPIISTLETMKGQHSVTPMAVMASTSKYPHAYKNIVSQRCLSSTKKKGQKIAVNS